MALLTTENLPGKLWSLLALSLACAALACFLQTCMEKGMILRGYKRLVFGLWWRGRARRAGQCILNPQNVIVDALPLGDFYRDQRTPPEGYNVRTDWYPARWWRALYKPLGGCVYCNGPHLLWPYFLLLTVGAWGWPWLLALAVLPLAWGVQYIFIELFQPLTK